MKFILSTELAPKLPQPGGGAMSCSVNGGGESGLELVNKGLVGMCVTDGLCSGAGRWASV